MQLSDCLRTNAPECQRQSNDGRAVQHPVLGTAPVGEAGAFREVESENLGATTLLHEAYLDVVEARTDTHFPIARALWDNGAHDSRCS